MQPPPQFHNKSKTEQQLHMCIVDVASKFSLETNWFIIDNSSLSLLYQRILANKTQVLCFFHLYSNICERFY